MIRTGLEFAPGTSNDTKKAVGRLINKPEIILSAYRTAREAERTSDIVLVMSDQDPNIYGGSRAEYARSMLSLYGRRSAELKIYDHSAQKIMNLPSESEAMWLVVHVTGSDLPIMCVIFGISYDYETQDSAS